MATTHCIGLVLAGGRSSRMGQNKAYLQRQDQSMLEYASAQLSACGVDEVVVSGSNSGGIADIVDDGGPLAGIHAALSQLDTQALLVLPVDMPLMTKQQLSLLKQAGETNATAQYFNQVSLPAYIPVNDQLTNFLENAFSSQHFIDSGRGPSLRQLFKVINAQSIDLDCTQALINTNTPEQWQQSQQLIKP